MKWWNSVCSTCCKTWSKIPLLVKFLSHWERTTWWDKVEVTAWLSKTLAISWLFPLRTLATQNLLETHIPTSHSQKKVLWLVILSQCQEHCQKTRMKKLSLKSKRESMHQKGKQCLCILEFPSSATKLYLVSARSTPGILVPVKPEDFYPTSPVLFHVPRLRPKSLQGKAKTT